jgi:peroxiredoxin
MKIADHFFGSKWQFLFIIPIFLTSCNQTKTAEKAENLRTPEEDQKILDEKLFLTNKRWDSLEEILHRKDLEETYRDSVKKLFFENRAAQEEIFKSFIEDNPASVVSVSHLDGFKFSWGKKETQELFNKLDPNIKQTEKGKKVARYLRFFNRPEVGDIYTDFVLPDLQGEKKRLSENLSDYTLLEFWASWCTGCRKEHPQMIKVYEKFRDQGFSIIGISGDNAEVDWKTAVEKDELPWLNLRGTDGKENIVQYQYGIHYLPSNFLIGPNGKILAKDVRPQELEKLLQETF